MKRYSIASFIDERVDEFLGDHGAPGFDEVWLDMAAACVQSGVLEEEGFSTEAIADFSSAYGITTQ